MNILVATGLYDTKPQSGGSLIMKLYVDELRRQGHNVYLLYDTSADPDPKTAGYEKNNYYLPQINDSESAKRNIYQKVVARIANRERLKKINALNESERLAKTALIKDFSFLTPWLSSFVVAHPIDVVQVDFPWMINIASYLPKGIPRFFVSHELQSVRYARETNFATDEKNQKKMEELALACKKIECEWALQYDVILTLTDIELNSWQRLQPKANIQLSPMGIDLQGLQQLPGSKADKMVFLGNGKHQPNIDALQYLFTEILPLIHKSKPRLPLHITGNYAENIKWSAPSWHPIVWEGFVHDLPVFMRNAISVVPMRTGSGIRIKILESMAMGCPVVSTPMGAEGIIVKDGESILLAITPEEFAEQVIRLANEDMLYAKIGRMALETIAENYNLKTTVKKRITQFEQFIETHKQI